VTEELLAKVEFSASPPVTPPIGELAEVTVALPAHAALPVVPNASIQRVDGRLGVWLLAQETLRFVPVKTGATDLQGQVQILQGLQGGEQLVVYSRKALGANSRVTVVAQIPGVAP
jgi:hypothetical protein